MAAATSACSKVMNPTIEPWAGADPPSAPPPRAAAQTAIPLRDLVRLLLRRKRVLFVAAVLGAALGVAAAEFRPKNHTAEGLLVVDTTRLAIPEVSPVASARTVEPWGGRSEARILTARETIGMAVDRLGLVDDPAFNPTLKPPPLVRLISSDRLPAFLAGWLADWAPAAWLENRPERGPAMRSAIIDSLRAGLDAGAEERSYAITLTFAHPDPEKAAAVVNAVMTAYLDREREAQAANLGEAREELEQRLADLGDRLARAKAELAALERESEAFVNEGGTVAARSLEALLEEARNLRSERERVEADLARMDAALTNASQMVLRPALITPRLEELWAQEAVLVRELAEAGRELGERHPRIITLRSQLEGIEEAITRELRNLRAGLESERRLLAEREEGLRARIEAARETAGSTAAGRLSAELARQEVESLQSLRDLYRDRLQQALVSPALIRADARIVSHAEPPAQPAGPGRGLLGGLGLGIGLLLATACIVGRRWLSDKLVDPEDATRRTGLAVLGILPRLGLLGGGLPTAVSRAPEGQASETFRALLAQIKAPFEAGPARIVMVASADAAEGKTSISVALARVAQREGMRCLVIEGDCRRPGLRALLGNDAAALAEETGGRRPLPFAIMVDRPSGAHLLVARPMAHLAPSLLRSDRLRLLFRNARDHYDLVIIDAPPLLATADSLMLARHADTGILIAAADRTRLDQLEAASTRLKATGCHVAGIVLNRMKRPLPAGHSFSGYSSRPMRPLAVTGPAS